MSLPFILLAAQAAGFGGSLYAGRQQNKFNKMQYELNTQEMGLRLNQERLQSTEATLFNTERLRETLASQRAIFATKGQLSGQGSAHFTGEKSVRAFTADERAKALSQGFREHSMKHKTSLLKVKMLGQKAQRRNNQLLQGMDMFSFNSPFMGGFGG